MDENYTILNTTLLEGIYTEKEFSRHTLALYTPAIIYTVLLMVSGIFGNSLVWIIYYWKWKHMSTRIFILSLAMCDLINCVITMPTEITIIVGSSLFHMGFICKISRFTTYMCNSVSTLVLIAVAVDRYQRICCPHRPVMTSSSARRSVAWLIGVSLLITWPAIVLYGKHTVTISSHGANFSLPTCQIDDSYVHTKYPLVLFGIHAVGTLITFTSFIILYSCVAVAVRRQLSFRKRSSSRHTRSEEGCGKTILNPSCVSAVERSVRTTVILSVVTFSYVLTFLPFIVLAIHRTLHPSFYQTLTDPAKMAYQVILRSYLLNCCINPIIYSFLNTDFRKRSASLFKQGVCKFISGNYEL
ncbi:neuropeptide Y receptor type 6-like [Saccostrea cucullata]|uniref:neuropeptide Y receptor type 6-like n=1 Tax=Saccostrea cuccullata TaxID=36930 RepID=UPI002ED49656